MPDSTATLSELPLRKAMEARDLAAATDAFAPDAVVHSPLTDRLSFRGRDQIAPLIQILLDEFHGFHYTAESRTDDVAFLVARANVAGQEIELVDHLRLGPDGRVREMTVFFRPLPAAAATLGVFGGGLARRRSALRARVIAALARPLAVMARIGDALGVYLIRSTL